MRRTAVLPPCLAADREYDMMERAHAQRERILAGADYQISAEGRRAIEDVLRRAEQTLVG